MRIELYMFDRNLRHFLAAFIILLISSTMIGLLFVYQTTKYQNDGIIERYNGSSIQEDEFDIPENYPKSYFELLLNTHNHLFGFAFIFLSMGFIFYFNSFITGYWKYIILIEPFFSVILTFSGIWAMRFINPGFVVLVILGGVLTYTAFFIMAFVLLFELLIKKDDIE